MNSPPPVPSTLQYATPIAFAAAPNEIWRQGRTLVTGLSTTLPPRCIRCGEPEAKTYTKVAYWHSPLLYLLIFFPGILIYAIVALCVRKKSTYTCSLCPAHVKQKRTTLLLVWLGVLLMLAAFAFAIAGGNDAFGRENADHAVFVGVVSGIVLLIGTILFGAIRLPLLTPQRIDKKFAYYKGASAEFLAPLNEFA